MPTYITLVQRFHQGAFLEPGDEFVHEGKKLPRHAALKGSNEAVLKPLPVMGDTKPKATQKAVKEKVQGLNEQA